MGILSFFCRQQEPPTQTIEQFQQECLDHMEDNQMENQFGTDPYSCAFCGSELGHGERFCGRCGTTSPTFYVVGDMPPIEG